MRGMSAIFYLRGREWKVCVRERAFSVADRVWAHTAAMVIGTPYCLFKPRNPV